MIELKPFFIETKNYLFTYHGGGYAPKKLHDSKRSNITSYSNSSQKRLLLYLDTVEDFKPTMLLFLQFPENQNIEEAGKQLKAFLRSLSNPKYNKNTKPALFIWKKIIYENHLVFEILTNLNTTLPNDIFVEHLTYLLNEYNKKAIFNTLLVDNENTELIKANFGEYRNKSFSLFKEDESTGRWWGVVNKSHYKNKEPIKTEAPLSRIVTKEKKLSMEENLSRNIFNK